ncbi:hypothetical protein EPIR_3735 [Erwinia piriflorinigrans CFBP 5888]|uniref:Uncharacterized protein n=1 Tax=Erwinia piriflorinigrans CFBP 5888 TaxID=1161919 RepID=V5ZCK1_9GAMM|nr:hypothetical protein EPIR_3735 [Erwinia piriflorinigrans CFBP 5888]
MTFLSNGLPAAWVSHFFFYPFFISDTDFFLHSNNKAFPLAMITLA